MVLKQATHVAHMIPLGPYGQPEEIANLVGFICSDFGSWLSRSFISQFFVVNKIFRIFCPSIEIINMDAVNNFLTKEAYLDLTGI